MLKITTDDKQLTDKINEILNSETVNNIKKATIDCVENVLNDMKNCECKIEKVENAYDALDDVLVKLEDE